MQTPEDVRWAAGHGDVSPVLLMATVTSAILNGSPQGKKVMVLPCLTASFNRSGTDIFLVFVDLSAYHSPC